MALKLILLREVGLRFAMASVFYVFFYEKLAHVGKKQYLCSRVAFGKLVVHRERYKRRKLYTSRHYN